MGRKKTEGRGPDIQFVQSASIVIKVHGHVAQALREGDDMLTWIQTDDIVVRDADSGAPVKVKARFVNTNGRDQTEMCVSLKGRR